MLADGRPLITREQRREVDTIIFGTGFHVTDPPQAGFVRGRHGQLLADAWRGGMSAYLGTVCHGFPNAFMLVGPNTALGHSSMVYMIESQVAYVVKALRAMGHRITRARQGDAHSIRVDPKTGAYYGAADRRISGKAAGY